MRPEWQAGECLTCGADGARSMVEPFCQPCWHARALKAARKARHARLWVDVVAQHGGHYEATHAAMRAHAARTGKRWTEVRA